MPLSPWVARCTPGCGPLTGKSFNPGEHTVDSFFAIKFFKSIKKTPSAPARGPRTAGKLEIEKFLRQVADHNGIKINFDACPGGACKKPPASKKKPVDDDLYSDDSDLESCDEDDE